MKISIDNNDYTKLRNISISSEVDITGADLPVNEFSADIVTNDNIQIGRYASLFDNAGVLIAKYWITEAVRYSQEAVSITAQSDIRLLDRSILEPTMYFSRDFETIINDIFTYYKVQLPQIDIRFAELKVSGYCPEQTGRERLQWLCIYAGAYVRTDYTDKILIKAINQLEFTPIFDDHVFYRPQISYGDWVTGIRLTIYKYSQSYPTQTDDYIMVNGDYYVETTSIIEVTNTNAPKDSPENIIEFSDIKLINESVANDVINRLALYYFNRIEVAADILNNGDYKVGDYCFLNTGLGNLAFGFIRSMDFSFGRDTKTSIGIKQAQVGEATELIIQAMYNRTILRVKTYYFPSGYAYKISNSYISTVEFITPEEEDDEDGNIYMKTVYMPEEDAAVGVTEDRPTINAQQYEIALQNINAVLSIYSVDELGGEGVVAIE